MQSSEEGLQQADELVQTYLHSCSWFIGPFYHLVRLFHPDYVKPLLMAPGSTIPKSLQFIITAEMEFDGSQILLSLFCISLYHVFV